MDPEIVGLMGLNSLNEPPALADSKQKYRDAILKYSSLDSDKRPAIVIDSGSYNYRAGWSFEEDPYLQFRTQVAKPKTFNKEISSNVALVGDEVSLFDQGRVATRTPYDSNVVYHVSSLESILDYTFSHLGIYDSSVNFPILMTEPFANPNYSRAMTSELMFECY